MKTYVVDLDGVLCDDVGWDVDDYINRKPNKKNIEIINKLKKKGNRIIIFTSRPWGMYEVTTTWLKQHSVKYDILIMGKPYGDVYIDDKAVRMEELK